MIDRRFVILGALVGCAAASVYIRDTLRGRTQPNRVTWLLWGTAPMLAFAAELDSHVGLGALMTFTVGFNPLLVFLASFVNPKAAWRIGPFDLLCGVLSVGGTLAWLLTNDPDVALVAAIGADLLAALPTVRKALISPATETGVIFVGGLVNSTITLLAARHFTAAEVAFPIYIFAINALLAAIVVRPWRADAT